MLVGSITNVQKTLVVSNPQNFPSQGPFEISCESEKMLVTQTQGKTFLVNRAYAGSTAASHADGKQVAPIITSVNPAPFVQSVDQIS